MGNIRRVIRGNEPTMTVAVSDMNRINQTLAAYRVGGDRLYYLMRSLGPGLSFALDWGIELDGMDWCAVELLLADYYSTGVYSTGV